jgi:hypothetical protein
MYSLSVACFAIYLNHVSPQLQARLSSQLSEKYAMATSHMPGLPADAAEFLTADVLEGPL